MDALYVDVFIYSFIHLGYFCPGRAGLMRLRCITHASVAAGSVIQRAHPSYFMSMHILAAIPVLNFQSQASAVRGETLLLTFAL